MDLNDTARVRRPRDAVEYRLGTVTDITYAPHSTDIRRLRLRFPSGDERTYTTAEIIPCTREDDRSALVAAAPGRSSRRGSRGRGADRFGGGPGGA